MSDETESEPTPPPPLPALIDDYVAQREALAGLRREVAAAAGREAQEIVAAARAEIERSLVKAQRELLVLRAQGLAVGTDPADHEMLQALSQSVDSARQLLQHSRVELDPLLTAAEPMPAEAEGEVLDAVAVSAPRSRGRMLVAAAAVLAVISIGALAGIARLREAEASVVLNGLAVAPAMALADTPSVQPEPPVVAASLEVAPAASAPVPAAPAPVRTEPAPALTPVRAAPAPVAPPVEPVLPAIPATGDGVTAEDPGTSAAGSVVIPPPPPGLEAIGPGADIALIRTAAERWLEAFLRGDATAMRALGGGVPTLADERVAAARGPGDFTLQLDGITTQVIRGNALYTARLTQSRGDMSYVSFVSLLWAREGDGWRLIDVRVVDQAAVQTAP